MAKINSVRGEKNYIQNLLFKIEGLRLRPFKIQLLRLRLSKFKD